MNKHCLSIITILFLTLLWEGCVSATQRQLSEDYYNIGNAFMELREYEQAIENYERSLRINPAFRSPRFNLAKAYIETEKYEEAIVILNDLLSEESENTIILSSLGYVNYKMELYSKSITYFNQILELIPGEKDALFNSAVLLTEMEKYQESLDLFLDFQERSDDIEADILWRIAYCYERLEMLPEAIDYLERYEAAGGDNQKALNTLTRLYRESGNSEKALDSSARRKESSEALLSETEILLIENARYEEGFESLRKLLLSGYNDEEAIEKLRSALSENLQKNFDLIREEVAAELAKEEESNPQ